MQFLAFELIALILLFAVDDTLHDRPPAVTWGMSLRLLATTMAAMAAVTVGQLAAGADVF